MQCAHISKALIFNEQENHVVEQVIRQYLPKNSDFANRVVIPGAARCGPSGRPNLITALASHEGVVAELHKPQYPQLTYGCQQKQRTSLNLKSVGKQKTSTAKICS